MNRIKECRVKNKISQKYLAIELGVTPSSVCLWESGKNTPSMEYVVKMAEMFEVSTDYLLGVDHIEEATGMPVAEIQQATVPDREVQIKRMEHYDQMTSLLSGLTPENKEKALAYIKYLEFTQE